MVNRLKLNEKNVREAENLGRDYQIFEALLHKWREGFIS